MDEAASNIAGVSITPFPHTEMMARLPPVRGKLTPNESLAAQTWFRVGGAAQVMFKPADAEDLAHFLAGCPEDIPLTVIGVASNLLVRDGGIPGVVIKLGPAFTKVTIEGTLVTAGAAAVDLNVARTAQAAGVAGLEFLSGIPGTVGGGLRMNAGAYGREFKDLVIEAHAIDRAGEQVVLFNDQMGFSYRHTDAPSDLIFIATVMQGTEGDPEAIRQRMSDIQEARANSQPIREKTGGSTFANPDNDPEHRKSWQLIDAAGCRGLQVGGAMMSEKHANFMINTGTATASDLETLGETVRGRVMEQFGIPLRWEIKRIGVPLNERGVPEL